MKKLPPIIPVPITYRRDDPLDFLNETVLEEELAYMGVKTLGQLKDEFDDIMHRLLGRHPNFFDDLALDKDSLKEILDSIE